MLLCRRSARNGCVEDGIFLCRIWKQLHLHLLLLHFLIDTVGGNFNCEFPIPIQDFEGQHLIVRYNGRIGKAATNESFRIEDCVERVGCCLGLGGVAYQTFACFANGNIRRRNAVALIIWNDFHLSVAQKQATKDAGAIAGLTVERLLTEPTAAAMAYGFDTEQSEKNILVFDFGGGTFDVSVLAVDGGVFEVLATNGDSHLGGEDVDERIMQHMAKGILKQHGIDVIKDANAQQKLRREAERVKRALSTQTVARLEIDDLGGVDFTETLTRARFEEINSDLFKKTLEPVRIALDDAGLEKGEIDEIVFVGGSTRIPKVRDLVSEFFGGKQPVSGVNPDEAVAYGAAVQGGVLSGDSAASDIITMDITPLSTGIETVGGIMTKLIKRGTVIPTKKSRTLFFCFDTPPALSHVLAA